MGLTIKLSASDVRARAAEILSRAGFGERAQRYVAGRVAYVVVAQGLDFPPSPEELEEAMNRQGYALGTIRRTVNTWARALGALGIRVRVGGGES